MSETTSESERVRGLIISEIQDQFGDALKNGLTPEEAFAHAINWATVYDLTPKEGSRGE